MNIIEKIKKNALAMSLALATVIGFSAFKANESGIDAKNTIKAEQDLHWYVRDSNGQYSEFIPTEETPTVDQLCPTAGPQICALGFESEMDPAELSDSDVNDSADQRYRPLN